LPHWPSKKGVNPSYFTRLVRLNYLAPDLKAEHDPLRQASGKREVPGFA
jgi:hypothetical protein